MVVQSLVWIFFFMKVKGEPSDSPSLEPLYFKKILLLHQDQVLNCCFRLLCLWGLHFNETKINLLLVRRSNSRETLVFNYAEETSTRPLGICAEEGLFIFILFYHSTLMGNKPSQEKVCSVFVSHRVTKRKKNKENVCLDLVALGGLCSSSGIFIKNL